MKMVFFITGKFRIQIYLHIPLYFLNTYCTTGTQQQGVQHNDYPLAFGRQNNHSSSSYPSHRSPSSAPIAQFTVHMLSGDGPRFNDDINSQTLLMFNEMNFNPPVMCLTSNMGRNNKETRKVYIVVVWCKTTVDRFYG